MKPNIGIINAMIRITCGFTLLAWATARLVRRPKQNTFILVIMMGAMKVAEGITRYCPLTDFMSFNDMNKQRQNGKGHENSKGEGKQNEEKSRKHKHLSDLDEKAYEKSK